MADFDIVHDQEGEPYLQCRRCGWLYKEEEEKVFVNYFKKGLRCRIGLRD